MPTKVPMLLERKPFILYIYKGDVSILVVELLNNIIFIKNNFFILP